MSNQSVNHDLDPTHLKNVFEQSLAMLDESQPKLVATKPAARLHRNAVPLHIDPVVVQKRALDDAAKALATLWNISGPTPARLQSRQVHNRKVA